MREGHRLQQQDQDEKQQRERRDSAQDSLTGSAKGKQT